MERSSNLVGPGVIGCKSFPSARDADLGSGEADWSSVAVVCCAPGAEDNDISPSSPSVSAVREEEGTTGTEKYPELQGQGRALDVAAKVIGKLRTWKSHAGWLKTVRFHQEVEVNVPLNEVPRHRVAIFAFYSRSLSLHHRRGFED